LHRQADSVSSNTPYPKTALVSRLAFLIDDFWEANLIGFA
jgi:hypothetical protein